MDKKIKIKYIDKPVLKKEADAFREKYWDEKLPINIERIIENMGIEIVPLPNIFKSFGIDALITSNW